MTGVYVHLIPTVRRVPNQPATQHRSVRVDDELWEAMKRATADQGTNIAAVTREFYERYVRDYEDRYVDESGDR